jgi:peptidyl-prolyl cis-trans isomerase A (cyclophilin A)/peptidyl-prolyl cis-trans isomerase B (cyclophilin B)
MTRRFLVFLFGLMLACSAHAANPMVEIKTNMGSMTVELYPEKAPKTVENFLHYTKSGFYKGTVFHRVIQNFMIQGGGFDTNLQQKETLGSIRNEAGNGLKNEIYTIAMARRGDPHSASSQFFINGKDNDFLDFSAPTQQGFGYCVFGKVVKGTEVVDKISAVRTGPGGPFPANVPEKPVIIEEVRLIP